MKQEARDLIEKLDLLLRKGDITTGQALQICDRVDELKDADEINRIFVVKGIAGPGGRRPR